MTTGTFFAMIFVVRFRPILKALKAISMGKNENKIPNESTNLSISADEADE